MEKGIVKEIRQDGKEVWYGMYTGIDNLWVELSEFRVMQVRDGDFQEDDENEGDLSHLFVNKFDDVRDLVNMCEGKVNKAYNLDGCLVIINKDTEICSQRTDMRMLQQHEIIKILRNWRVI